MEFEAFFQKKIWPGLLYMSGVNSSAIRFVICLVANCAGLVGGKIRRNDWLFFTLWHSKFIASNNFVIRERSTYTKADKTYHFLSISIFFSWAGVAASLHNLLFCVQQLVICRMRYIIPPIMLLSLIFDGRIIDFFPFWKSPKPTLQTRGTLLVIVLHPFLLHPKYRNWWFYHN